MQHQALVHGMQHGMQLSADAAGSGDDAGMQHLQVQLAAQAVQAGAQPAEVQLLQHLPLAAAAAAMQAHAARLLRIVLGSSHAACDRAVYASCSAGLPFQLGAAMARLAQLLAADQAAGSR